MMQTVANYEAYSPEALASANDHVVLFFHADWCPICRKIEKNISSSGVPDNLTILKINYDEATELKKKYGVASQSTLVQVNKEGEMIQKWTGTTQVADILARLKKQKPMMNMPDESETNESDMKKEEMSAKENSSEE